MTPAAFLSTMVFSNMGSSEARNCWYSLELPYSEAKSTVVLPEDSESARMHICFVAGVRAQVVNLIIMIMTKPS